MKIMMGLMVREAFLKLAFFFVEGRGGEGNGVWGGGLVFWFGDWEGKGKGRERGRVGEGGKQGKGKRDVFAAIEMVLNGW